MNKYLIVGFLFFGLLFWGAGPILAQDQSTSGNSTSSDDTISAGITPDSFWWWLDRAIENLSMLLAFDPAKKAEKGLNIALERLLEIKEMFEGGKVDAASKAEAAHDKVLEKTKKAIDKIEEKEAIKEARSFVKIEHGLLEQKEKIEEIRDGIKIKIEVKGGTLASQADRIDYILGNVGDRVEEVRIKIDLKKDRVKIKIKEDLGKSEEEAEQEIKKLEKEEGVLEKRIEKASEQISDAKDKLSEAESKLADIGDTSKINMVAVNQLLSEAKEKISVAEAAFENEKYGEAFGQADAAENLAKNVKRLLEGEDDGDEGESSFAGGEDNERDELEKEIEVEINEIAGVSHIKIKVGDLKLRFDLSVIDLVAIVDEISARTGLSKDEISAVMKTEKEENEDDIGQTDNRSDNNHKDEQD